MGGGGDMQQSRNQTVEGDAGGSSRRAAAMWVRHRLFPTDLCRCILSSYTSTYPPAAAFQDHRDR